LAEVEKPLLPLLELLELLALALAPVAVAVASVPVAADPVEPPELPLGVVELEPEFKALAWKAAKVLLAFALTANTIPCLQWPVCLQ